MVAKSATPGSGSRRLGKSVRFLMLTICSLAVLSFGGPKPAPAARYNLLVISIDTLRADHLKCYGYNEDTSPHLDQFAQEGVLFESVTAAASWTAPSHMSVFTSLYPSVHHVQTIHNRLWAGVGTLAQRLSQSGYVTAAFVTGPVLNHHYGFDRGFQHYDDFTLGQDFHCLTSSRITNLAAEWLKKHSQENFFLFLHYFDCHFPYQPPASFIKRFDPERTGRRSDRGAAEALDDQKGTLSSLPPERSMTLYDGAIAYTDDQVGKILHLLQDLWLSDKTLVIVLSDHGEAFLEHGAVDHGNSLYEEEIHVPLIMRLPGVVPAGKRIAGNVSQVDLMPTALGLLGLAGPSQMQGIDLSPVILRGQRIPERLIYSELAAFGHSLRAVRWGDRKLVATIGTLGTLSGAQLEELAGGREKVIAGADLKKECPEVALRALAEGPSSILKANAAKAAEPDAELIRQLKSLGYVE